MANEAIDLLMARAGEWINDTDLISAEGPDAILRLRTLRSQGLKLRARPHPNGQGLQWRYEGDLPAPPEPDNPSLFPIVRTPTGGYEFRGLVCFECKATYSGLRSEHEYSPGHRAWVAASRNQTQIAAFEAIPDEPTAPIGPERLVFGQVKPCPRCHGLLRPVRKDRKGNVLPADKVCMDPDNREVPCRRCHGVGVVSLAGRGR